MFEYCKKIITSGEKTLDNAKGINAEIYGIKNTNARDKYLITTNRWFVAPDGCSYLSAWGEVEILNDTFLGIKTNRNSTNWYVKVGSEDKHVIIGGCQINYAVKCNEKPFVKYSSSWDSDKLTKDGKATEFFTPSKVYIAE